jgi:hypothetical protein
MLMSDTLSTSINSQHSMLLHICTVSIHANCHRNYRLQSRKVINQLMTQPRSRHNIQTQVPPYNYIAPAIYRTLTHALCFTYLRLLRCAGLIATSMFVSMTNTTSSHATTQTISTAMPSAYFWGDCTHISTSQRHLVHTAMAHVYWRSYRPNTVTICMLQSHDHCVHCNSVIRHVTRITPGITQPT